MLASPVRYHLSKSTLKFLRCSHLPIDRKIKRLRTWLGRSCGYFRWSLIRPRRVGRKKESQAGVRWRRPWATYLLTTLRPGKTRRIEHIFRVYALGKDADLCAAGRRGAA
jgi:hypothetical protein